MPKKKKKRPRGILTKKEGEKRGRFKNADATTYFGCTAAPDDSCGAPSHAALPSDVLPASSAPLHWGGFETAARHNIPVDWGSVVLVRHRIRLSSGGAGALMAQSGDLRATLKL